MDFPGEGEENAEGEDAIHLSKAFHWGKAV